MWCLIRCQLSIDVSCDKIRALNLFALWFRNRERSFPLLLEFLSSSFHLFLFRQLTCCSSFMTFYAMLSCDKKDIQSWWKAIISSWREKAMHQLSLLFHSYSINQQTKATVFCSLSCRLKLKVARHTCQVHSSRKILCFIISKST